MTHNEMLDILVYNDIIEGIDRKKYKTLTKTLAIDLLVKVVSSLEEIKNNFDYELEDLKDEIDELNKEIEELESDKENLEEEIDDLESKLGIDSKSDLINKMKNLLEEEE